jgi:hypothetical protein
MSFAGIPFTNESNEVLVAGFVFAQKEIQDGSKKNKPDNERDKGAHG